MFEWLKQLLGGAGDISQMAEDGAQKAREITNMIPGEADDAAVEAISGKVEEVTQKFEDIKKNLPGQ